MADAFAEATCAMSVPVFSSGALDTFGCRDSHSPNRDLQSICEDGAVENDEVFSPSALCS